MHSSSTASHAAFDAAGHLGSSSRGTGRPPSFDCSPTDRGEDASWIHLAGELDIATAPLLEQTLHASRPRGLRAPVVVLDMRDLEFLDTSGVHVIANAGRRARQAGGRLVLVRGPRAVDRLFTLTGSRGQFEIVDLDAGEPVVMALLRLAARRCGAGARETVLQGGP